MIILWCWSYKWSYLWILQKSESVPSLVIIIMISWIMYTYFCNLWFFSFWITFYCFYYHMYTTNHSILLNKLCSTSPPTSIYDDSHDVLWQAMRMHLWKKLSFLVLFAIVLNYLFAEWMKNLLIIQMYHRDDNDLFIKIIAFNIVRYHREDYKILNS